MPKRFELTRFVFASASVALLISFTGCRTPTTSLASVPGFGWLNRGDEGWAQFEPAPDLPRPSETTEPSSASGVGNIAKSDPARGSGSRSFDTSVADLASKERFDKSRYLPKATEGSKKLGDMKVADKKVGDYASAFGKYGPPKPLNQNELAAGAQSGPYDVETPKYTPNFAKNNAAKSAGKNNFAQSGYDLGYGSGPATAPSNATASGSKPYVSPSTPKPAEETPPAAEPKKPAPFGYVAGNRFEAAAPSSKPATPAAAPRFTNEAYTPPGFAKTTTQATNDLKSTANELSTGVASKTNDFANRLQNGVNNTFNSPVTSAQDSLANAPGRFANAAGGLVNKTSNAVSQQAKQFTNNVNNTAPNAAQQNFNKFASQAKDTANSFGKSAGNTLGQYANTAKSQVANAVNSAQGQAASAAQAATNNLGATAQKSFNSLAGMTSQAKPTTPNFTQGFQQAANNASATANNAIADARSSLGSQAQKATNYAQNAFNKFANDTNAAAKTAAGGTTPGVGQFQTYAQQAQQKAETAVASTYNQTRQNVEQSVSSQYQQAKSAIGEYANSTVSAAQNKAANVANSITNSSTYQSATAAANNAKQQLGGVLGTASNTLQNVSASAYPSTNTPNPYVVPGPAIKGAANRMAPAPSASSVPSTPPSNYNIPPTNNGPAFRTATPFLPGSTQPYKGAQTTRKATVELASANVPASNGEQLVLAVGDAFQFPRTLR